jgi:hypothetical protein
VPVEAIVLLVAALWFGLLFLATFLCKAAKLGDEALENAHSRAVAAELESLDPLERRVRERVALRYPATGARSPLVIVRSSSSRTTSAPSLSI